MKFWNQPLFQTRDLNFFRKDDGTGKVVECLAEGEKRERRGGERTLRASRVRGQDFPRRLTTGQRGGGRRRQRLAQTGAPRITGGFPIRHALGLLSVN